MQTAGSVMLSDKNIRVFIVLATIGDTSNGVEVGQFLVRSSSGVRIDPTWDVMGMRSTASDDIVLEDAFVPDEDVVSRRVLGAHSVRVTNKGVL